MFKQNEKRKRWSGLILMLMICSVLCNEMFLQAENETWTLQSCVEYAKDHNVEIRQSRVSRDLASVDEKLSQAAYLPTLSMGSSQRYTNRPYGDPAHHYNGNYDITANWTLYDGSRRSNIEIAKQEKSIADLQLQQAENNLTEKIMQTYVNILYGDESVLTNDSALQTIAKQVERSRILYEAGQIAVSEYAQMQSQFASQQYALVSAQNVVKSLRLELCQLMNIEPKYDVTLSSSSCGEEVILSPLPDYKEIYRLATLRRPEIRAGELMISQAESSVKVARSGYYPTISVGAGISTVNEEKSPHSVGVQLKENWSNSAGLSFNVPILSGRQNKSALEKAKLRLKSSKLDLENSRNNLLWTIENYWLEAKKAQSSYVAAREKLSASQTSYNLVEQQYDVGLKTPTDLLTQRDLLLTAQEEYIKAKYQTIYNINMLRFYAGEPLY